MNAHDFLKAGFFICHRIIVSSRCLRAAVLPETLIVIILGVIVEGNCLHLRLMMLCMGTGMLLSGLIQDTEP